MLGGGTTVGAAEEDVVGFAAPAAAEARGSRVSARGSVDRAAARGSDKAARGSDKFPRGSEIRDGGG